MLEKKWKNNYCPKNSFQVSSTLLETYKKRRSTRAYSGEIIPEETIQNAIKIAGSAPSGANKQPWMFYSVSDLKSKNEIKALAEKEEIDFYQLKPNKTWIEDLKHLHTNEDKSFLSDASHLIPVFYKNINPEDKSKNYYAKESVGIATGFLLSALHLSGISTLTYTPKHMKFLKSYLDVPAEYHAFMVIVAGIPPKEYGVPTIEKKTLDDIYKIHKPAMGSLDEKNQL